MNKSIYASIIEADTIHRKLVGERGGASQNLHEMTDVIEYLDGRKFNNFVEIGVSRGGSFFIYTKTLLANGGKARGFDIQYYPEQLLTIDYLKKCNYDVDILIHHSYYGAKIFSSGIDLLHIDGSHDLESIHNDFNLWYPKIIAGGVVLLHDTMLHEGCRMFRSLLENTGYNIKTFYHNIIEDNQPGISVIIKK